MTVMTIGGFLLGVINIAIVAVLLILFGLIVEWMIGWFDKKFPPEMRKFYIVFVMLVCLYMFVALFIGLPTVRLIR